VFYEPVIPQDRIALRRKLALRAGMVPLAGHVRQKRLPAQYASKWKIPYAGFLVYKIFIKTVRILALS
jgi:hypothetical protein